MRNLLWKLARAKSPEGAILPKWLLVVRIVLFPLDSFYWRMSKTRGYQIESNTWMIEGIRYSGEVFCSIAKAEGGIYRITRSGETITFELVDQEKLK